jgi:Zn-dependent peptidase ImmA (M78 family)
MSANLKLAKQKARELLDKHFITEPTVNVFDITKKEGLKLNFVEMPEKLRGVAGFLDIEEKQIYLNKNDSPTRIRFTTAHELGHYILQHEKGDLDVLMRNSKYDGNPIEQEANYFAANLLAPKDMLVNMMKRFKLKKKEEFDVELLAKMFGVSKDFMKYRLELLSLWKF